MLWAAAAARAWGFVPVYQTFSVIAARVRTAQHLSSWVASAARLAARLWLNIETKA